MDNILKEDRFAHIIKDPKFRRIPINERKVKIDKRFQSMFTDERFNVNFTRDKRGRPCIQKSSENLRKYYNLSDSDDETSSDFDEEESQEASNKIDSTKEKKLSKKLEKNDNLSEDDSDFSTELLEKSPNKAKSEKKKKLSKNAEKELESGESSSSEKVSEKASNKKKNKKKKKVSKNLEKNQDLSEDEASGSNEEASDEVSNETETRKKEKKILKKSEKNDNKLPALKKGEKDKISSNIKQKLKNSAVDYARGDGVLLSSSSEEESVYDSEEDDTICHDWGEFDKDAEEAVESTRRLAACSMDWDKIRAVDLMVSFNSFIPSGGVIHSVTIYPSEFGLKRMQEEEVKGPTELINDCHSDSNENEEGSSYQMEKLRQYQLNRLKYYYAVVVCDSPETADKLWNECKNMEYESSGTKFDLRFIPDDMEFDQTPKEVCDQLPDFTSYQPRVFTTTALQQEKVDLTWDETNEDRIEITKKINSGKFEELNEKHLKYIIASGSSEDESDADLENNENKGDSELNLKGSAIDKYKQLLKAIDEKEREKHKDDVELECTWGFNAEQRSKEYEKDKQQKSENRTPFEEFLDKKKEKRKAKRQSKLEQKANKSSDLSDSEDEVPSDIDMNDPYFADELKNTKKGKKSKMSGKDKTSPERDEQQDELELIMMDADEIDNRKHFNMDDIEERDSLSKSKKKRLKRKNKGKPDAEEDDFKVNVTDDRFDKLYTSHLFNIDPADNHYRKTKGTEVLVSEQLKRRRKN